MATHVWFAAQAVLVVVTAPYAFLRLRLTALELGLVSAVVGVGRSGGGREHQGGPSPRHRRRDPLPDRAVVVVVSPLAGLAANRAGYGWGLAVVAAVFTVSGLQLLLSPFRRARTG